MPVSDDPSFVPEYTPSVAYKMSTVAQMQNIDPQAQAHAKNGDLHGWGEAVRNKLIANLLNGFTNLFAGVAGSPAVIDLQDKTQKLEGVVGYCHTYSLGGSSNSIAGDIRIPIDAQIGPIVGATIANGAIYLSSKGLWVADAQLSAEGYTALGSTYMNIQIRVYSPSGTLHAQRIAEADTTSRESLLVHVPFVVPSAGYYVELWGNAAFGRGSRGGNVWNGMSVEKRSTETS
ncbi:hypothetical protein ACWFRB_09155 [Rhodococcus sp. NPDC055112]